MQAIAYAISADRRPVLSVVPVHQGDHMTHDLAVLTCCLKIDVRPVPVANRPAGADSDRMEDCSRKGQLNTASMLVQQTSLAFQPAIVPTIATPLRERLSTWQVSMTQSTQQLCNTNASLA